MPKCCACRRTIRAKERRSYSFVHKPGDSISEGIKKWGCCDCADSGAFDAKLEQLEAKAKSNPRQSMKALLERHGWQQTYLRRATRDDPGYASFTCDNVGYIEVRPEYTGRIGWCHCYKQTVFGTSLESKDDPADSLGRYLRNLPPHTRNFTAFLAWEAA